MKSNPMCGISILADFIPMGYKLSCCGSLWSRKELFFKSVLGHCAHECSMHSFKSKRTLITSILAILCKKNLQSLPSLFSNCLENRALFTFMNNLKRKIQQEFFQGYILKEFNQRWKTFLLKCCTPCSRREYSRNQSQFKV